MVSPDDVPPEPDAATDTSWRLTGILTIVALGGLWWAGIQHDAIQQIASSLFQMPTGRWILWSLTLVVVGLMFGLAVACGAGWRDRLPTPTLLWGLLPLAAIVIFHLELSRVAVAPRVIFEIVFDTQTQVAAAMAVGVFLAGLLVPILPTTPPPAPEDA